MVKLVLLIFLNGTFTVDTIELYPTRAACDKERLKTAHVMKTNSKANFILACQVQG